MLQGKSASFEAKDWAALDTITFTSSIALGAALSSVVKSAGKCSFAESRIMIISKCEEFIMPKVFSVKLNSMKLQLKREMHDTA